MPDRAEIIHSLYGAWRLAHGDVAGMTWFEVSGPGFYRSFSVWIFVIPAQLLLVLAIADTRRTDLPAFLAAEVLMVVTAWLLYLCAIAVLLRQAGRPQAFAAFAIAYNWAQVLLTVVLLPLFLLLVLGGLHTGLAALVYWIVQLLIMVYIGIIARAATGAGIAFCLGIAVLDQFVFRLVFAAGHDLLLGM